MIAGTPASELLLPERRPLDEGWFFCSTAAGALESPAALKEYPGACGAVRLPCTVGAVLRDRGGDTAAAAEELDDQDHWFRCEFDGRKLAGRSVDLVFHGLATICEIWLNGERLGTSTNMFVRSSWDVGARLSSENELVLCFRALGPMLRERHARARWRTQLVEARHLRFYRTTLMGRMSSWCPPIAPVGPWRAVELLIREGGAPVVEDVSLRPSLNGEEAFLEVAIQLGLGADGVDPSLERFSVEVAGESWPLEVESRAGDRIRLAAHLRLSQVEAWWPHTHGAPRRYSVTLRRENDGTRSELEVGRVGFRHVEVVGPPGPGFRIEVNGTAVFCRGTCWTPVDALALQARPEELRSALELARDAGMNMLRVAGTTIYESDAFYALCDELGILVWQDFMFATLDYPADDEAFMASVELEVDQFLERTRGHACLAVLCGNSEGQQQPAMLGLDAKSYRSALFEELLPEVCARRRPDLFYWPSTPSGGELPFHAEAGTSHYFGVGAYRRPLTDARMARPRFMTECLAFANVPGEQGADSTPLERIPRDRGADWDFMDVTDHYLPVVFGEEAAVQGRGDAVVGAALRRATSAEVLERTQAVWRDPSSSCGGSLVWLHRDPWPCAGWGVVDAGGRPKSAYYGLKRAWQPIAVCVFDDGLNGLRVRVHNEFPLDLGGELEVVLMRVDGTLIRRDRDRVTIRPRSSLDTSVDALLGGFVDSSYAYRFGPREFDVCVVRLFDSDGDLLAEAIHWPLELGLLPKQDLGLRVEWLDGCAQRELGAKDAVLEVASKRFVQGISLALDGGRPEDNFFHLAPDRPRRIRVEPDRARIAGTLRALNTESVIEIPEHESCADDTLRARQTS